MGTSGEAVSPYQAFAVAWHLRRGDLWAAQRMAAFPVEVFAGFDRLLFAAYLAGAVEAARDR